MKSDSLSRDVRASFLRIVCVCSVCFPVLGAGRDVLAGSCYGLLGACDPDCTESICTEYVECPERYNPCDPACVSCDDSDTCTTDTCIDGVCLNTPICDAQCCDDGDPCTQDSCENETCAHKPVCSAACGAGPCTAECPDYEDTVCKNQCPGLGICPGDKTDCGGGPCPEKPDETFDAYDDPCDDCFSPVPGPCSGSSCQVNRSPGALKVESGSVKFSIGLGQLFGGDAAPTIWMEQAFPGPELADFRSLSFLQEGRKREDRFYDSQSRGYYGVAGVQVMLNYFNPLQPYMLQVRTTQTLADIIEEYELGYWVFLYESGAITGTTLRDGATVFALAPGTEPIASIHVENPDVVIGEYGQHEVTAYNRLSITEYHGGSQTTPVAQYLYTYDYDLQTWVLDIKDGSGNTVRSETKSTVRYSANKQLLETLSISEGGNVIYQKAEWYGWEPDYAGNYDQRGRRLLSTTVGVGSDQTTATRTYWVPTDASAVWEQNKWELKTLQRPDGSWLVRDYQQPWPSTSDAVYHRLKVELEPVKDQPPPTTVEDRDDVEQLKDSCATTLYNYDRPPSHPSDPYKDLYDYTIDPDNVPEEEGPPYVWKPYAWKPRQTTELVAGTVTRQTYKIYPFLATYEEAAIEELCAHPDNPAGHPDNLRTVTEYYVERFYPAGWGGNGGGIVPPWKRKVVHPDGRQDTYSLPQRGEFFAGSAGTPGTFTPLTDGHCVKYTIVHGSTTSPNGIANKTTVEEIVENGVGRKLLHKVYVNPRGQDDTNLVEWTEWQYDNRGRLETTFGSRGQQVDHLWHDCCRQESTVDANGIQTDMDYGTDPLRRPQTVTRLGTSTDPNFVVPDLVTSHIYGSNSVGYTETRIVAGGTASQISRIQYDTAGRVSKVIQLASAQDTTGLDTTYQYGQASAISGFSDGGGKRVTITRPDGGTEITDHYRDGRIRCVTGTDVVSKYYDYWVDSNTGYRWSREMVGAFDVAATPLVTDSAVNRLDQTVEVIEYSQAGLQGAVTKKHFYNTKGQLVRTETWSGGVKTLADMLYEYDEMGELVRSGLDVNTNGTLGLAADLASEDRITEIESGYEPVGGVWWQDTTTTVYTRNEAGGAPVSTRVRRKLTGLAANVVEETVSVDRYGNETVTRTTVNRTGKEVVQTVNFPDSSVDAVATSVNGLLKSQLSKESILTSFAYDGVGRQIGAWDARTNAWNETSYNALGQVQWTEDTADKRTTFDYYPVGGANAGRLWRITDALQGKQYFDYYADGQPRRTWGDTTYPVEYVYDTFGRRTELRTFRAGTWTGETWPGGTPDTTTFVYGTGGLSRHLTQKGYADGTAVQYTHRPDGKLETRTWARTLPGNVPIVTAYSYHPSSGDVTAINYSDSTPDVGCTYDRLGRPHTVTDAVGTRTFTYHTPATSWQDAEEIVAGQNGLYSKTIVKGLDTGSVSGFMGRIVGLSIGGSPAYSIGYGYDQFGRLDQLSGSGLPAGGIGYLRAASSNLVEWLEFRADPGIGGTLATTHRAYDSDRNLVDYVENRLRPPASPLAKYDYRNDDLGRRRGVEYTGSVFIFPASFDLWGYNSRSELNSSRDYSGTYTDSPNPATEQVPRSRLFHYDNIGNRTDRTQGTNTLYYCVEQPGTGLSLNQYTCTDDASGTCPSPPTPSESFTYDADGNMTGDALYTYEWDAENRLVAVVPRSTSHRRLTFVYDYMGRRVRRTSYQYVGGNWLEVSGGDQMLVYDRWNVIQVLDANSSNQVVQMYTWGLDLSGWSGDGSVDGIHGAGGIGGLLAVEIPQITGESRKYGYMYDANGNVVQLVSYQHASQTASLAANYEYDAYGRMWDGVDPDYDSSGIAYLNPFRFSTKWFEEQTFAAEGLYYYGYRYYLPRFGRWASRDPIGEEGGANLYAFVTNAPANQYDPHGLFTTHGVACALCWMSIVSEAVGAAAGCASGCIQYGEPGQKAQCTWDCLKAYGKDRLDCTQFWNIYKTVIQVGSCAVCKLTGEPPPCEGGECSGTEDCTCMCQGRGSDIAVHAGITAREACVDTPWEFCWCID